MDSIQIPFLQNIVATQLKKFVIIKNVYNIKSMLIYLLSCDNFRFFLVYSS